MPVMDEFREEREALKHGTPKEKISYFIEYYKWHVIVTVAVIAFVVSLAYQILTRKDTAFYAAMINGIELASAAEYTQSFAEYAGIDTDACDVLFDTSLRIDLSVLDQTTINSSEKLTAYIVGKDVDVFVTDGKIMEQYAHNETFFDLREFLSEEQYTKYKPYFYYIDQAIVDEKNAAYSAADNTYVAEYPDPRNPDAMRKPVPVGIYLDTAAALKENYHYAEEEIVVGVVRNTERAETAAMFIDFILR